MASMQLTNEAGEVTSHLQGILYRTIRMLRNGIKPVFVFDGKPPEMKSGELQKRRKAAQEAKDKLKEAKESGDVEAQEKFSKRTVRMTSDHIEDCKRLLRHMGIPVVEAPSEAESQCAELVKKGKAWATSTEDMDALTFGTNVQLRRLTHSEAKKMPVLEINLAKVLEGLQMTQDEFIDFCILCGCDYCDSIRGIGPKTALNLVRKHKTLEKIVESLKGSKKAAPETFLEMALKSRSMFKNCEVTNADEIKLKWKNADEEEVKKFLVDEKGFNEDRINKALVSLAEARKATQQKRIDSFFSFGASSTKKKKSATTTKKNKKNKSVTTPTTKTKKVENTPISASSTTATTTTPTTTTSDENDTAGDNKRKKPSFSFSKKKTKKRKTKKTAVAATSSGKPSFSKR
jgi:flap endonuclease-1